MNFDKPVLFYREEKKYNPTTSKWELTPTLVFTELASVTDIGASVSIQEYGDLSQDRVSVRLMYPLRSLDFTYFEIYGRKYKREGKTIPRGIYLRGVAYG